MATAAELSAELGGKSKEAAESAFEAIAAKAFDSDSDDEDEEAAAKARAEKRRIREMNIKQREEDTEETYEIEDENEDLTFAQSLKKLGKEFVKIFIDYGPPYTDEPHTLQGSLVDECSELNMSLFNLHMLLNDRADPNIPDAEDLYYTPMHWCGRNFHLLAAKMLLRAKANINRPNEFGITPFGLCVITTATDNYRSKKLKMIKWFLKKGADVNWRDKGGLTALDYAVMNDDVMAVKLLLAHGALTDRNNKILVAPRVPVLDHWRGNPEVYKMVLEANEAEMDRMAREEMERWNAGADKREAERVAKLHHDLAKLKETKIVRKKTRESTAEREARELEYKRKLLDALDYLKISADKRRDAGGWIRNEVGQWHWKDIVKKNRELDKLYTTSVDLMHKLRKKNKIDEFNNKWEVLTKGGKIEMKWDKADKFRIEGEVYSDEEEEKKDPDEIQFYQDENDAELEGEDLDDMMDLLK